MPATSKAQFRFMAFCQHADHPAANCPKRSVAMEFTQGVDTKRLPERKSSKLEDRMIENELL